MENFYLLDELVTKYQNETPDNVIGVGYGNKITNNLLTTEMSIIFTVKKKIPIDEIDEENIIPSIITYSGETFLTDVVELEIKPLNCPSSFYTWQTTPPTNRNMIRPLKGGISMTNFTNLNNFVGTLGFLAVDNETNSLVGVSNNHVLVYDAFLTTQRISSGITTSILNNIVTQPNEFNNSSISNSIGVVKRYKPITNGSINYADVALTTIRSSDVNMSTSYLMQGVTGWTQPLIFASSVEIDGLLSNKNNLFSAGRTTGSKGEGEMKLLTSSYPVTINIAYTKQGNDSVVQFGRCIQFIASASTTPNGSICSYPINGGDSGSALVADFSGTRKIVGLVFAGGLISGVTFYGYANRIDDVANQINISAWTGQTVNYSNTGMTETYSISEMSSLDNIILSGKTFWQAGTVK
jgi:hypothetical protein